MRRSDINPKVFISHASEDRERFLRAFATKLRQEVGVDAWPGLTSVDTLVLKLSCQKAIEGFDYFIQTHDVWEQVDAVGVPLVEFNDSLEVLHGRGYIRTDDETLGSADESPLSYTIQIRGFEEYARAFVENY